MVTQMRVLRAVLYCHSCGREHANTVSLLKSKGRSCGHKMQGVRLSEQRLRPAGGGSSVVFPEPAVPCAAGGGTGGRDKAGAGSSIVEEEPADTGH